MPETASVHDNTNAPPDEHFPVARSFSDESDDLQRMPITPQPVSGNDDSKLLHAPVNDSTHAELLATKFGQGLAFVPGLGWKSYDNGCWKEQGDRIVRLYVEEIVKLRLSVFDCNNPPGKDYPTSKKRELTRERRRLEKCGNYAAIAPVVKLAADRFTVDIEKFDKHPHLLNAVNGIIDLKTGALLPHDQKKYLTHTTGLPYDPGAKSERWDKTILEIADSDKDVVDFLQLIAGIAASGDTSIQKFFYFFGQGGNGKSLITSLWVDALGGYGKTGYAVKLPSAMISGRSTGTADTPSPTKLQLQGRRLGIFDEQDGDKPFNDQLIKSLTGEDSITARAPHSKQPVTFLSECTLMGMGNNKPAVNASDHGIWRRLVMILLRRTFKPSRLGCDLRGELPAILTWMVQGAMRFYQSGLSVPDSVAKETDDYRDEADSVRGWLKLTTDTSDPGAETDGKDLFQSYEAYCKERREFPGTHNALSRRLTALNFTFRDSNGRRLWKPVRLLEPQS